MTHKELYGDNRCKFTYSFTLKVISFEYECWESNQGKHVDSQGEIKEKSGKSMLEFWQTPQYVIILNPIYLDLQSWS